MYGYVYMYAGNMHTIYSRSLILKGSTRKVLIHPYVFVFSILCLVTE